MNNSNVRFKDFVWPVNPSEITFSTVNDVKELRLLYGGCVLQNLGRKPKVISGKGSFSGENAFSDFEKLQKLFDENTSGILLISGMPPCLAMFSTLKMLTSRCENTVSYEFKFIEDIGEEERSGSEGKYLILSRGQNLWRVGAIYSIAIEKLMELNPQIASPFEVEEGQRVRIE